ncbi:MAG: insulinase family protein [Fimbriimonadaceae bacterium]
MSLQQESPRLRTALPNGAIILVERMPEAKTLSVQLFASSRRVPESTSTHGKRHLLEHILALGPKRSLDQRLESNGSFLWARTYRDATQFEISGPPGQLDLALDAVNAVLQPLKVTQPEIDRELKVLAQEFGLLSDPSRLSSAAWKAGYGDEGLDPIGSLDGMASSPEDLAETQKLHFAPDGLVLVISGPVSIDQASSKAKKVLAGLKPLPDKSIFMRRGEGKAARGEAVGAFGEARGALVKDYKDPMTAASLAAALAVASQFDQSFVTYTPSIQNGLILVGRTDENSGLGLWIEAQTPAQLAELYPVGKSLARSWVERQLKTPAGSAYLRGLLLVQGEAHRPELMLDAINGLTQAAFLSAMDRLGKDRSVIAVGVRR